MDYQDAFAPVSSTEEGLTNNAIPMGNGQRLLGPGKHPGTIVI